MNIFNYLYSCTNFISEDLNMNAVSSIEDRIYQIIFDFQSNRCI